MSSKYLDIFLKEAQEHLDSLQTNLLVLEKEPGNKPLIHELLRNAHTLKGSARMLGFEDISVIGHRMEDFLKEMEDGERPVDSAAIDLLLQGSDAISRMTEALANGADSPVDLEKFIAAFDQGLSTAAALLDIEKPEAEILGDTIRTSVKTLDSVVNLLGELIINKKRFEDKSEALKALGRSSQGAVATDQIMAFQQALEEDVLYLGYIIQELHAEAMALRMLPLRTITEGFIRMVRDLSKAQGKEIDLEIRGEHIEIDRLLLENLKPMFLHMLTNAVDHGIERPEERVARGKPAKGTVRLTARHEGNNVVIEIRDDGVGMDPAKIKAKALGRGIIDKDEAEMLKDEDALYLTLRQGFSTSEIVTDISGRGVGMDVVKMNIEKVKGNLTLRSEVGAYTEVELTLPLTLAVIDALMISCSGEQYAIPLSYVQETLKIRSSDIATVAGKEVLSVRNITVPLFSLAQILGFEEQKTSIAGGKLAAVILKQRDQIIACTIDKSHGTSEIVVKSLGGQLKKVRHTFGATVMGDGNPALILDVPDIFATAEGASSVGLRRSLQESQTFVSRGNILVVDDSITTRTMEKSILVANGYEVTIAISAEDALDKIGAANFDLVISDVEMPGLNGFELTARLRAIDEYKNTPVIIVSSLSKDEHKRKAIEAGAQAYIVKGAFEQGTLLDTVESLIG
ncbi:MAG: hybrid sensor histidine kinase/response regulator [Deltaproteobacteria bacterium HGW-Deltaproteobacteria-23]|nr:MAG: hybrid sensor histidine kinase/response regulator [Deltaproteobacteria bacterium HGW-Deltaproteobacteria-23]